MSEYRGHPGTDEDNDGEVEDWSSQDGDSFDGREENQGRSHKTHDEEGRPLPRSERADMRTVL